MKKSLVIAGCVAALLFPVLQLHAQTGLQHYQPAKKWHGLDLKLFLGNYNTFTGGLALNSCTTCSENVADGYQALYSCTTCDYDVAVGYQSSYANIDGSGNVAIGAVALTGNSHGYSNTAVGAFTMNGTSGNDNVAVGNGSMSNSTGSNSVAVGNIAMATGENNSTAVGFQAMYASHSATGYNTAVGAYSMGLTSGTTSTGAYNVAFGASTLFNNTSGAINNAIGYLSLYNNTTGLLNAGDGYGSLYNNSTGSENTAVGAEAMESNTTGTYNTALGFGANTGSSTLTNATALGANATVNSSNQVVIGNSSVTSIGGYAGWSNFSDGRYKRNIQENVPGLVFINKLVPITYTLDIAGIETRLHRSEPSSRIHLASDQAASTAVKNSHEDPVMTQAMQEKAAVTYTGFVAQDVEKAAQSVNYVFSGVDRPKNSDQSFYGLRYSDFVPPLVKAVQELSAKNDDLQSKYDSLQTQVNELRAMLLAQKSVSGASLEQNAPNPFSGSTVIGYNLPVGVGSAQLQITDVSGKVLAMIPLSGSGRNTVTANVAGYAAGTYQYSLIVDGKLVGTRQMVSVR